MSDSTPATAARVLADCLLTGSDPFTTDEGVAEAAAEAMTQALWEAGFQIVERFSDE